MHIFGNSLHTKIEKCVVLPSVYNLFFFSILIVSNLQAAIDYETVFAEEAWKREEGGYTFCAVREACDIFSPVFVSSIRAHAA